MIIFQVRTVGPFPTLNSRIQVFETLSSHSSLLPGQTRRVCLPSSSKIADLLTSALVLDGTLTFPSVHVPNNELSFLWICSSRTLYCGAFLRCHMRNLLSQRHFTISEFTISECVSHRTYSVYYDNVSNSNSVHRDCLFGSQRCLLAD